MHPVFCSLLDKSLVLTTPGFPRLNEPANVANQKNTQWQKPVDDWDKENELVTSAILANLPPQYKHLVYDDTLSAGELWGILKASSVSFRRLLRIPRIQSGWLAFEGYPRLSMSARKITNVLLTVCHQCQLRILMSAFSPVFFILLTRLV